MLVYANDAELYDKPKPAADIDESDVVDQYQVSDSIPPNVPVAGFLDPVPLPPKPLEFVAPVFGLFQYIVPVSFSSPPAVLL
jgi:hypothetical protein